METLIVSAGKRSRTVIVDTWISKSITAPTQAYKGVQSLTHFQSTKKFSDNRNSRAEALVASSTTKVRFASDRGCQVVNGRWVSAFTAYSRPRLPLIPDEVCHPFHAKAATNSTAKLPPQQTA